MRTVTFQITTSKRTQMLDITPQVQQAVTDSGVTNGVCVVFIPHTTAEVIIEDGHLLLGTWQDIYFCEFDGPRNRKVIVKIMEG